MRHDRRENRRRGHDVNTVIANRYVAMTPHVIAQGSPAPCPDEHLEHADAEAGSR